MNIFLLLTVNLYKNFHLYINFGIVSSKMLKYTFSSKIMNSKYIKMLNMILGMCIIDLSN